MKEILKTIQLSSITLLLTFLLIKFPEQALKASIRGLNMWWEVVFPSLLPFFITAELLIGFGVVTFFGILFEPIMRPLFNVPGAGSFAWVMGMASGYPSGAKISTRLREEKQISQIEAERLISFTNAASPLFIFAAISVGFLHDAKIGILIAVCHYIGNTLVGLCMRFYGKKKEDREESPKKYKVSIIHAFKEMHKARINDGRTFGEILGDAVANSVQTLLMVGGFIILFSVFTKLLALIGISSKIANLFQYGLKLLTLPIELGHPLISGLFEITSGAQMISEINMDSILPKVIVISFILGFNGFSIQAQVSSIIAKSDIRFFPYFISRLLHGTFAGILTVLLFNPLYANRKASNVGDIPVIQGIEHNYWTLILHNIKQVGPLITIIFLGITIIILYRRQRRSLE